MESKLKKFYEKKCVKMTKEELLEEITRKIDRIDESALRRVVYALYDLDYSKVQAEYIQDISDTVERVLRLIDEFEESTSEKDEILRSIVATLKAEKRMLISHKLYDKIAEPILYSLDKKDLDASAYLMEKRLVVKKDTEKYGPYMRRSSEAIDRMDFLDKFIEIIAEQCDEETAMGYIQDISDGKYASLLRIIDGAYVYIGKQDIVDLYRSAVSKVSCLED